MPRCSATCSGCSPRRIAPPAARRVHVVLDNYGIHHAKLTNRALAELGDRIVLHFLPPYCLDANRIERVWQELHANVTRNHRCKTLQELLTNCRQYVENYRWRTAPTPARSGRGSRSVI